MKPEDKDIEWTQEPIIGLVLVTAQVDSHMNPIDVNYYYKVGKHLPTGLLIIIPADRMDSVSEFWNGQLKNNNRLN